MDEGLKFVRRNLIISSISIILMVIVLFYTLSAFSKGFGQHVAHSPVPIETTQIRFILWDLALKFFFQNPVTGIGLGQFSKLSTIGLQPKYQIFYLVIANIGTHNLLLSYLSETGIIGAICFLFFLYASLKLAWLKFKLSTTPADLRLSGALLGGMFYIVITSLYAGQWTTSILGMMLALTLAWTVILKPNSQT
jgi:O-antigen ligase